MADQLSGIAIIICIAFGVLTFLLLFIFANRQIKRFSLKSRSGPHAPVAVDAAKVMQLEIDRRFDVVRCISYHPNLLKEGEESLFLDSESEANHSFPVHLYRMKVLDSLNVLETIAVSLDPSVNRLFYQNLRLCLVRLYQRGLLPHIEITVLHRLVDLYESARHEPGEFTYDTLLQFMDVLDQVQQSISPRSSSTQPNDRKCFDISSNTTEMGKNLSNGKAFTLPNRVLPSPEHSSSSSSEEEEKKVTYETSV